MLDINRIVPPMVEDILTLEPQFPEIVPTFPIGILTAFDYGAEVILSGEERITNVSFQIDIYDISQENCEIKAKEIAARLIKKGFWRGMGQHIKEDGLHRHLLTFSAKIDEQTGLIYRR